MPNGIRTRVNVVPVYLDEIELEIVNVVPVYIIDLEV